MKIGAACFACCCWFVFNKYKYIQQPVSNKLEYAYVWNGKKTVFFCRFFADTYLSNITTQKSDRRKNLRGFPFFITHNKDCLLNNGFYMNCFHSYYLQQLQQ
jgi:hypothetical protein